MFDDLFRPDGEPHCEGYVMVRLVVEEPFSNTNEEVGGICGPL